MQPIKPISNNPSKNILKFNKIIKAFILRIMSEKSKKKYPTDPDIRSRWIAQKQFLNKDEKCLYIY